MLLGHGRPGDEHLRAGGALDLACLVLFGFDFTTDERCKNDLLPLWGTAPANPGMRRRHGATEKAGNARRAEVETVLPSHGRNLSRKRKMRNA